ncbi:hypothetical protein SYNPS1DRAFT_28227 [Syncephalis pseudoplumigaleata]|uniref:DEK-C domain-containing protein n=1 Tax=Syncephalis pseudoplumigaleata TaxID=1712513 RepID=A0A4P9Z2P5_9FUNG|nr:hypothetical protein SYNPS1DRAFT_28227 [Syncephalis pseudoplumigaleata]|eukprot:RKP26061.1 hypothetical protein SYNPS1DRAFT_28227 [Syncephalis pseudoplumigaleata]
MRAYGRFIQMCLDALYKFLCKPWNTDLMGRRRTINAGTAAAAATKPAVKRRRRVAGQAADTSDAMDVPNVSDNDRAAAAEDNADDAAMERKQKRSKQGDVADRQGKEARTAPRTSSSTKKEAKVQRGKQQRPSSTSGTSSKGTAKDKSIDHQTLRTAVNEIIAGKTSSCMISSDLETMTPRNVREELAARFKCDMAVYKADIKRILNDIVMEMVDQ